LKLYKVTVTFDRMNPKTGSFEKDSERFGSIWAESKAEAKKQFLDQFKKNEPTRRKISSVTVV